MNEIEKELRRLACEMLIAENEYGCGFYGYEKWVRAYEAIAKICGYQRDAITSDWISKESE